MASAEGTTSQPVITDDDIVNAVVEAARTCGVKRYFTIPGRDPFDEIEWEIRDAYIPGKDKPVFEQKGVEFPRFWSQTATNIVAQKYFRGRMSSPERESSVRQMIGRVVDTITAWGRDGGYFATDEEAETFEAELKAILVNQIASFTPTARRGRTTATSRRRLTPRSSSTSSPGPSSTRCSRSTRRSGSTSARRARSRCRRASSSPSTTPWTRS